MNKIRGLFEVENFVASTLVPTGETREMQENATPAK